MKGLRYSAALGAFFGLSVLGCEDATIPMEVPASRQTGVTSVELASAEILHTYANSLGQEVVNLIPVSESKLLPLLPAGYNIAPAASLGIGAESDGIVAVANFRGIGQTVDDKEPDKHPYVGIWVAVVVTEPSEAAAAGVSIPGAFHLYALAAYVNNAQYFATLRSADMPVEFLNNIDYQRSMDDASGVGDLIVRIPSRDSPFYSFNHSDQSYIPAPGAVDAVFWHDGSLRKVALHYHGQPFRQGLAISQVYAEPQSRWDILFSGGGFGPCAPDPESGYSCVIAPSFNLRYDQGSVGTLLLIE